MTTSKTNGTTDSEDLEAELIAGLGPEMRERVTRVRRFSNNVRECIRRLRTERCDWSQRELAERIGVSTSTISRLEKGRGFGGVDMNIVALALDAMNVAPCLSVVPIDSASAGSVVVDGSNRVSDRDSAQVEDDIRYGRAVEEPGKAAVARSSGGTKAAANEITALRAELHELHRDVDSLRRLLTAGQAQDGQRSAG